MKHDLICTDWHPMHKNEMVNGGDGNRDAVITERERRPSGSCLKSPAQTPPGTPTDKKQVHFADEVEMEMEKVQLQDGVRNSFCRQAPHPRENSPDAQDEYRYLAVCFPQPGYSSNYLKLVREKKVYLETLVVAEDMAVLGKVRVENISYQKNVIVRFTTNDWKKYYDIPGAYVQNSSDGTTDQFSFTISLPKTFSAGSYFQFAVCYKVCGHEYWDNNHGSNYIVACYAKTSSPTNNHRDHNWSHHFV
uniref:Glycogen-binding subunit 76A-like n=1 Tax=Saccoglossus kowalevskii TaxID=10224 RepID=A0ABM0GS48_SACKO|nr:PREDICTED: glycogen-binding subunit 76A-like [Saccoglossus kowalevskii]